VLKERESSAGAVAELRKKLSSLSIELGNKTEEAREWEQKYVQLYAAYKHEFEMSQNKYGDLVMQNRRPRPTI
jgi:hypothetical protein